MRLALVHCAKAGPEAHEIRCQMHRSVLATKRVGMTFPAGYAQIYVLCDKCAQDALEHAGRRHGLALVCPL